jgi:hypothetical protein
VKLTNFGKNFIHPEVKHGFHYSNFYETYNTTWYHMDIVIGQLRSIPGHSLGITPYFLSPCQLEHLLQQLLKTATRERTDPQTGTAGGAVKGTKARSGVGKSPGLCQLAMASVL